MKYFQDDFISFFKDLAANNNKEWFDSNRKRYETVVREPFKVFIAELIEEIKKDDPSITIEPKDAIFRINRDIRFSKDKTPYKLHVGAVISPLGRKDPINPGIYVELGPEHLGIFGGSWSPNKIQLEKIRRRIISHSKVFNQLISDKEFIKYFPGGIKGDKNKRLPKDLLEGAKNQELIFNKQFCYQAFINPDVIPSKDLLKTIMKHYYIAKPLKEFFRKAMA